MLRVHFFRILAGFTCIKERSVLEYTFFVALSQRKSLQEELARSFPGIWGQGGPQAALGAPEPRSRSEWGWTGKQEHGCFLKTKHELLLAMCGSYCVVTHI